MVGWGRRLGARKGFKKISVPFKRGRNYNWSLLLQLRSYSSGSAWQPVTSATIGQIMGDAGTSWWHIDRRPSREQRNEEQAESREIIF